MRFRLGLFIDDDDNDIIVDDRAGEHERDPTGELVFDVGDTIYSLHFLFCF